MLARRHKMQEGKVFEERYKSRDNWRCLSMNNNKFVDRNRIRKLRRRRQFKRKFNIIMDIVTLGYFVMMIYLPCACFGCEL